MKIIFQATEFKPTKKLTNFAHKKVETLDRFHDRIVEAHVHLKKIKSVKPDNKLCEIRIGLPGNDPFVSKRAISFEEAINKAVETMKRKIDDRKSKSKTALMG